MTFELILLQTQRRSNWLDEFFCYIILYVEVLASNFYSVFCTVYSGQELCPVIFPYQPQKIVVPLCLVYQVRGIQKNVATLMQVTMEALLAELLAVMGRFSLPSQSCANLETELSNYSPIEFTNACTTHNAKR